MKRFVAPAVLMMAFAACTPEDQGTRTDILRGKQLYADNCAACHGVDGDGGGAESLGLGAPPPGLRGLSIANGGVFPRNFVLATIDGLERHNNPTAVMPEFGMGDLGEIIQVEENGLSTPIPADLLAIANYLETLQN